ncbi:MAG: TetR/AcrR family transcriptional regulator [Actinomycetes bacterium]
MPKHDATTSITRALSNHDATVDGRRARSQRSHDAVVEALLALCREGTLRPSAAEVADRAGVSVRTVFRLFEDLDSLVEIAVEQQWERIGALHDAPDATGSRAERAAALAHQRIAIHDAIAPIVRGGRHLIDQSAAMRRTIRQRRNMLREQLEVQFDRELRGRAPADARELLSALEVACSFESIEYLRVVAAHDAAEAEAIVTRSLLALLAK